MLNPYDKDYEYYKITPQEFGVIVISSEEGDLCEFTPPIYEGADPIMIQTIGYGFTLHENSSFIEWEIIVALSYGQGNCCPWVVLRPEVDGGMRVIQGESPVYGDEATLYEDLTEALKKIQIDEDA